MFINTGVINVLSIFKTLGDGVKTRSSPGVAGNNPANSKPSAFNRTMFLNCFNTILGAGRHIPARRH